jgi:hypothetical protein
MKLKAQPKYYNAIKSGKKLVDYRDAHITFINEENGQKTIRDVIDVKLIKKDELPKDLQDNPILFSDNTFIAFTLSKEKRKK